MKKRGRGVLLVALSFMPRWLLYRLREFARKVLGKRVPAHPIDQKYGIETSQPVAGSLLRSNSSERDSHGIPYTGEQPSVVQQCLGMLPIDNDTVFIDIGCGKGRVLAVAMEYPFHKVIGIELSPLLCRIAKKNIKALRAFPRRAGSIGLIEGDATRFPDQQCKKLVLFLYNPFDEPLVQEFVSHVETFIPETKIFIVYCNPVHHSVMDGSKLLSRIFCGTIPYAEEKAFHLFSNKGESAIIYQGHHAQMMMPIGNVSGKVKITIPNMGAMIVPA